MNSYQTIMLIVIKGPMIKVKLITITFLFLFICSLPLTSLHAQDLDKAWEYFQNKQFNLATEEFKKVISVAENENGKDIAYAELCFFAAVSCEQANALDSAISYYTKCYEVYKSLPNRLRNKYYISHFNYLAELYEEDGVDRHIDNLVRIYVLNKQYEKAMQFLTQESFYGEFVLGKEHNSYNISLNNLAEIFYLRGQYDKALPLFLEALELAEDWIGQHRSDRVTHINYLEHLNKVAFTYKAMRQYEMALPVFLEAQKVAEKYSIDRNSLHNVAITYEILSQYDKALSYYVRELDYVKEHIRKYFETFTEKDRVDYLESAGYPFEIFNSFAVRCSDRNLVVANHMFDNALTKKGLVLKSLISMRSTIVNSGDTMLINRFEQWMGLKRQIANFYSAGKTKQDHVVIELEDMTTAQELELIEASKVFRYYITIQNYVWQDVQKRLKSNEAAIEFISFDYYDEGWTDSTLYYALILRHDSKIPEMIQLFEEKELEDYIIKSKSKSDAMLAVKLYGKKRDVGRLSSYTSISYADSLYSLIWEPLDSLLKSIETVYYSPSGLLHSISFAAIQYNDSLLLSDKYDLVYVSTTGRIARPISEKIDFVSTDVALYGGLQYDMTTDEMLANSNIYKQTKDNILYADNRSLNSADSSRGDSWTYLKGTLLESENIDKLLRDQKVSTTLYQGFEGNEESFKSLAGNNSPEIIHLATHGFFFPDPEKEKNEDRPSNSADKMVFRTSDNPLIRSGVIMSGANLAWKGLEISEGVDDGILTAYEVSGMDLFNTQLVVLSACETGLGDIKGSEGVYGLQRSFKMAGVDYLIMSLWQVPDKETPEFMTLFYTHLLNTKNIREAFTETQRAMRNKYDPYYWAAFVLIE